MKKTIILTGIFASIQLAGNLAFASGPSGISPPPSPSKLFYYSSVEDCAVQTAKAVIEGYGFQVESLSADLNRDLVDVVRFGREVSEPEILNESQPLFNTTYSYDLNGSVIRSGQLVKVEGSVDIIINNKKDEKGVERSFCLLKTVTHSDFDPADKAHTHRSNEPYVFIQDAETGEQLVGQAWMHPMRQLLRNIIK